LKIEKTSLNEAFRRGSLILDQGLYLPKKRGVWSVAQLLGIVDYPQSMLVMTLQIEAQLVGLLVLMHEKSGSFDQRDIKKFDRFREHVLSAVGKARLIRQLEEGMEWGS